MAEKPVRHGRPTTSPKDAPSPVPSGNCRVVLTETAEATYREFFQRANSAESDDDGDRYKAEYRLLKDTICRLIPSNPTEKAYALADPLTDMYRLQRGRIRVCWLIPPTAPLVVAVLYIEAVPERGAKIDDPAKVLIQLVQAGYYRHDIEEWNRLTEPPDDAVIQ